MSNGAAIRSIRKKMGLTPVAFADLVKCHVTKVYHLERDHYPVSDAFIASVCKVAKITKREFVAIASREVQKNSDISHDEIERLVAESDKRVWNF